MTYAQTLAKFACIFSDVSAHPLPGQSAGVEVYRNNQRANRRAALASAYPSILALVGADFFTELAHHYIATHPSPAANLHLDGAALPVFVRHYAPVADLPYLEDVARLDWALHHAHQAPDIPPLDPLLLAKLDQQQFGALRLKLHPALSLVSSREWPIGAILDFHHGAPSPNLSAGGQAVMVWRDRWQILGVGDAGLLRNLLAGQRLERLGLIAVRLKHPEAMAVSTSELRDHERVKVVRLPA